MLEIFITKVIIAIAGYFRVSSWMKDNNVSIGEKVIEYNRKANLSIYESQVRNSVQKIQYYKKMKAKNNEIEDAIDMIIESCEHNARVAAMKYKISSLDESVSDLQNILDEAEGKNSKNSD